MDHPVAVATSQINGRLSDAMLAPIGGGQRLQPQAAQAWLSLQAAAAADGIHFHVTDSYRTYTQQVALAAAKGLYSEGGLAAQPGTSNHGLGLAVDVGDSAAKSLTAPELAWLQRNAGRFGFSTIAREPWHWEYHGGSVQTVSTTGGSRTLANPLVAGDFQVTASDIPAIQKTIRTLESNGNYTAQAAGSSASGAYQIEDGTWNNYMGYAKASMAPPAVQDQFAASKIGAIIAANGGSAAAIPITWYYPAALKNPALLDTVPSPGAGNKLTIRAYSTRWLTLLKGNLNLPGGITGNVSSDPGHATTDDGCLWSFGTPNVDPFSALPFVGNLFPDTSGTVCIISRSQGRAVAGVFGMMAGAGLLIVGFGFVLAASLHPATSLPRQLYKGARFR